MRAIGSAVTSSDLEGANGERAVLGGRIARPGLDSSDDARFRRGDEPVLPRRADLHSLTDAHGQLDAVFRLGMKARNRGCAPFRCAALERLSRRRIVGGADLLPLGFRVCANRRSRLPKMSLNGIEGLPWGSLSGISNPAGFGRRIPETLRRPGRRVPGESDPRSGAGALEDVCRWAFARCFTVDA